MYNSHRQRYIIHMTHSFAIYKWHPKSLRSISLANCARKILLHVRCTYIEIHVGVEDICVSPAGGMTRNTARGRCSEYGNRSAFSGLENGTRLLKQSSPQLLGRQKNLLLYSRCSHNCAGNCYCCCRFCCCCRRLHSRRCRLSSSLLSWFSLLLLWRTFYHPCLFWSKDIHTTIHKVSMMANLEKNRNELDP